MEPRYLLRGVVGSRAYGLDHAGSDVDRLGVFIWPTRVAWSIDPPSDTLVRHTDNVDETGHEVAKFVRLALKCNPAALELLYLPDALYVDATMCGRRLIAARDAFLWTDGVRRTYGGYVRGQLDRLLRETAYGGRVNPGSMRLAGKTLKHARHCVRLLEQGRDLLRTGSLTVSVRERATYDELAGNTVADFVRRARVDADALDVTSSVLPAEPNRTVIDALLYGIRRTTILAEL